MRATTKEVRTHSQPIDHGAELGASVRGSEVDVAEVVLADHNDAALLLLTLDLKSNIRVFVKARLRAEPSASHPLFLHTHTNTHTHTHTQPNMLVFGETSAQYS